MYLQYGIVKLDSSPSIERGSLDLFTHLHAPAEVGDRVEAPLW